MDDLRACILNHRRLGLAFVLCALFMKALVPAGFMVSANTSHTLTVSICTDSIGGQKQMNIVIPGKKDNGNEHSDGSKKDGHCAFSGLSKVATSSTDAVLLALALAFIIVLGMAPTRRLPLPQSRFLLPPLRGPPATA